MKDNASTQNQTSGGQDSLSPAIGKLDRPAAMPSVVVGFFHGILSGHTDENWIKDWYRRLSAVVETVFATLTVYSEGPWPRIAAIRNRRRVVRLTRSMASDIMAARDSIGARPPTYLFGHSNGGVLALAVAEGLAALGHKVDGVCLMAPALRSANATRRLVELIDSGKLGKVLLVRATADRALGFAARMRIVCWPWGALGIEGWPTDEIPAHLSDYFETVELEGGHSDFLRPGENRAETFDTIALPFILGEASSRAATGVSDRFGENVYPATADA